jgi:hypothetical protein
MSPSCTKQIPPTTASVLRGFPPHSFDGFHLHLAGWMALPPACGATVVYELSKLPVITITPMQVSLLYISIVSESGRTERT